MGKRSKFSNRVLKYRLFALFSSFPKSSDSKMKTGLHEMREKLHFGTKDGIASSFLYLCLQTTPQFFLMKQVFQSKKNTHYETQMKICN